MEHKSVEQMQGVADVTPRPALLATRRARLEHWAALLEREPDRTFPALPEVDLLPRAQRRALRVEGSAIAFAYADPLLRASGLAGDTYGDARSFFDLREGQAHRLLCSCINGRHVRAGLAARRLRAMAARRLETWLAASVVGGLVGVPGAMLLFG
ncbi:hypothetical protein [Methylobacterium planeticum]|uniref:Uncharacterized protein n=1 Tax=Methylobacterium planeticum TaxID=2615211 RepID=A0A6N6MRA9_9HYPH|nr:hypothetical protein [Methylobacterium planeticum]KAB1074275.1 hypothetical protein F6X51_07780 [Methylobacterium planeticum]